VSNYFEKECESFHINIGELTHERSILGSRWRDNNIKMDLREIWWENVDWMQLVQHRNQLCELGNENSGSAQCGEFLD
jgi:hypothetical protein